ncbi:DUF3078 domain-containing protein [Flavobacterium agricola]|uniref:DUF3078 domain-containing protein n=1 Tax=Flavobacterium agricola TaxID=2870839 RepID=UPI0022228FB1|nr:DUF3078 domain-containing protein [Flavobacterium agricola]
MKKIIYLFTFLLLIASQLHAQEKEKDTNEKKHPIGYWERSNTVGLDLTQVSFVNWNAGGQNSVSALAKGHFTRKLTKGRLLWNNELITRYGFNKQVDRETRKTDDVFQINSTAGYRTDSISNWYYSAKFNFITQFTNGYAYPDKTKPISKPFAPAYLFLGLGTEYVDKVNNFNVYLSPFTAKLTLVLDQMLANQGSYGVEKAVYDEAGNLVRLGEKTRTEFGILVSGQYKTQLWDNINLDTRASLYTDYLNRFGNIDVDLQANLNMKVNKYVQASIFAHLIYDDDIKAVREVDGQNVKIGPHSVKTNFRYWFKLYLLNKKKFSQLAELFFI